MVIMVMIIDDYNDDDETTMTKVMTYYIEFIETGCW